MYTNIQNEAAVPPALYSLRRMTHQGHVRNGSKDSYEIYNPQQTAVGSIGEKGLINGISGSAPGSPVSVHDYRQLVVNLQKDLEESKKKGSELQQVINDLNSATIQPPNGSLAESQFLEGSSSNGSLGENVKDALIKHLQRQVTFLQANLYKSDGWATRVGNAMKERDRAVDDVTRMTNQMKSLEADNKQLQLKIDLLSGALQETKQSLQHVSEELQGQPNNSQLVSQLQDEVLRQKSEIAALTESLAQLDQENRNLKDSGLGGNCQSVGNMACSLELEHLHLVVDKLKSIVLEQRQYLLQLKKPNSNRNTKSLSSSSSPGNSGGIMIQDLPTGKKLASPTLRIPGSDVALENLTQQASFGHLNQTAGLKSVALKDTLLEPNMSPHRNLSASDFSKEEVAGTRRKLSSRDMLDDVFNLEDLNVPHPVLAQGEAFLPADRKPDPRMGGSLYVVENVHHKSPEFFGQNGSGDKVEKSAGQVAASRNTSVKSPMHRATQSEVLAYNRSGQTKASQLNWGSKSEIIGRPSWNWNTSSDNRGQAQAYKPASSDVNKFVQVSPGLAVNQGQRFMPTKQGLKEAVETVHSNSPETQRQLMENSGTMQMMLGCSAAAVQYENVNRNSPTFQQQLIHHPPANSQQASARGINNETIIGAKQTTPRPCTASHRAGQDVVYVNTSTVQNVPNSSSSVDPDPSRSRLSSDRLCPVCNHDYSHVSMEDFQTHVLDCFEDENPPETMKPQTSSHRLCPMCDAKFGQETSQTEFEKHVHSHFGEDFIGENFEVLS